MANLSIKPSKLEIQLQPGASYTQVYTITNNGQQSVTLSSSVDSWVPQGSRGNITYLNSPSDINLSLSNSDLKLGQQFILLPNQSRQLVLKIQVPSELTNGDRYLTFFINQEGSANLSTNSTQLIRLGSHLLISVSNTEQTSTDFKIINFKVKNIFIDTFFSPIKFSGEIQNQSDYFNQIDNSITITKNNTIIKELTIFPDNVLAHNSRQIRCLADQSPVECQLSKPLWPGVYQASIDKTTISFIVLPYTLFIIIIFLFIIFKVIFNINKK